MTYEQAAVSNWGNLVVQAKMALAVPVTEKQCATKGYGLAELFDAEIPAPRRPSV